MKKIAILYFSVYGTAEILAKEIAEYTGGKLIEIIPTIPYDKNRDNYNALAEYAKKEHDENRRPEINNVIDIKEYEYIFLGYPIWWYTFPMIIYTLFDQVDFTGKTLIPFNTHMGSKDEGTYDTIRKLAKNATVLEGIPIEMKDAEIGNTDKLKSWLNQLNM